MGRSPASVTADGGSPPDDQALIASVLDGDERAFKQLYERHQGVVARRLRRVLFRAADVEDVLQVTFVEAYRGLGRYRPEAPFAAWLQGIAFRQAANHLRKARRWSWLRFGFEADQERPSEDADELSLESALMKRQVVDLLMSAVEKLAPKKRIAFSLHVLDGMGFTEIGQMVGASPQTIRARVLSAQRDVHKEFNRRAKLAPAKLAEEVG